MSRSEVDILRRLMEESFSGAGEQALLTNVGSVPDEAWNARPEGLARSVRDIVIHLAACNFLGTGYVLQEPAVHWDPDVMVGPVGRQVVMDWLDESHGLFASAAASLAGPDLDGERVVSGGRRSTVREIIETAISHNHYHAGEINHLRSMISGKDRWAFAAEVEDVAARDAGAV